MKLVKCIVREAKVEATTDALKQLDVSGLTVTHAVNTRFRIATK
jgi:nitrogen regulatory protein PII